jgi:hypothetical protein
MRSLGALVGISSLRAGSVPFLSQAQVTILNGAAPSTALLDVLGVSHLLVPPERCNETDARYRWRRVASAEIGCVHERPTGAPVRYALVSPVVHAASNAEMIAAVRTRPEDPIPVVGELPAEPVGTGSATIVSYAPGHVRLTAIAGAPTLLLVRDSFAPGWSASVDGAPAALFAAAGIYFGIPLAPGRHDVTIDYRAPGLRPGALVCLVWIVGSALALVLSRHRSSS